MRSGQDSSKGFQVKNKIIIQELDGLIQSCLEGMTGAWDVENEPAKVEGFKAMVKSLKKIKKQVEKNSKGGA
jgi:hypothetical protein